MLQVRNLPDDVHAKLKRRAAEAGMSLSDYVGMELARLVGGLPLSEVRKLAHGRDFGITRADLDQAIEQMRAERDAR